MVALRLPIFSGMTPSIDEHLISEKTAALSQNTWLYSGALEGVPMDVPLHTLNEPQAAVAFRIPENMEDPTYLFNSTWVEFINPNTSFLSAPTAGDTFERFYWTSPSEAPKYNTKARIKAGQPAFLLGLPGGPAIAVAVAGGSSTTIVSRAYATTVVSEYGEEGPAGTPVVVNGKADATFTATVQGVLAGDLGTNRNIKKINVYRTITSAAGTTTYYLIKTLTAQTTSQTFDDIVSESDLASKPILNSMTWTAPPNLDGFVNMPNGIMAGWIENELWFSEPYRPHSWPAAYSLTLENRIIGLGVINQTLVICTNGSPYTGNGVSPSSITTARLAPLEPCLSRGSIVETEDGVFYTSTNGLILVNAGIAQNVTKQAVSRDKWGEIAKSARVRAAKLGGAYYAFGSGTPRVVQEDVALMQSDMVQLYNVVGSAGGFLIDAGNENAGVSLMSGEKNVVNLWNDRWSGDVLTIYDGKVWWLNQQPGYKMRPYKWRSKKFQLPVAKNFAAFRCYYQQPEDKSINLAPNNAVEQIFNPATQNVVVRIYADGRLVATREIAKSGELHRLPTGFIAEFWEVEFEGVVRVNSFQMATSVKELSIA